MLPHLPRLALILVASLFGCASVASSSTALDAGPDDGRAASPITSGTANPPDCPASLPGEGIACTTSASAVCRYECDAGAGGGSATCTGVAGATPTRVWQVKPLGDACIPLAPAPFACGNATCRPDQFCLYPCCGGAPPECFPIQDSGACPAGTEKGSCQRGVFSGDTACIDNTTCTPDPPRCVDSANASAGSECSRSKPDSRSITCVCG